jgi:hypothetical protein
MSVQFAIQWVHVLLGVFWFGSVLFADAFLAPGLRQMSPAGQQEFGRFVGSRIPPTMRVVSILVIALGVVRGTVFGRIDTVGDLQSVYGAAWLLSLAAAAGVMLWGELITSKRIARMQTAAPEDMAAATASVMRSALVELGGFLVVFTCMVVMHFS